MKKGQITIFVVMGLVLVIISGLAIYLVKNLNQVDVTEESNVHLAEIASIKTYTEGCMATLAKEAMIEIGKKGGYLDVSHLNFEGVTSVEGNALEVFPNSNIVIPFWQYLKSSNSCTNCVFDSEKPLLSGNSGLSIANQISSFVEQNLDFCVQQYDFINQQGFNVEIGEPVVEITFGDSVIIYLNQLVIIEQRGVTSSISDFSTNVDLDFKSIYDLASLIIFELDYSDLLEKLTLNEITIYNFGSSKGESKIPPLEGGKETDFFTIPSMYVKDLFETEEILRNEILAPVIPTISVSGSKNDVSIYSVDDDEGFLQEAFQSQKKISVSSFDDKQRLSELNVDFTYLPFWKLYLRVNNQMAVLTAMPEKVFPKVDIPLLDFPKIYEMNYNFFYDVSYPIMIEINDDSAFNGEGYRFLFATEINLRKNKPFEGVNIPSIQLSGQSSDVFCDYRNMNSGEVEIIVKDYSTNQPVSDLELTYQCGTLACVLGSTGQGTSSGIKTKLPTCMNGFLTMDDVNYFQNGQTFITTSDEEQSVEMIVYPKKELEINIVENIIKKEFNASSGKEEWGVYMLGLTPTLDEEFIVTMDRISDNPSASSFSSIGRHSFNNKGTIELVPGNYSIDIFSMLHLGENYSLSKVKIEAETRYYEDGEDKPVDLPEVVFNTSFPSGGLVINNETGYLVIEDDLYSKSKITLSSFRVDESDLEKVEDLEQMGKVEDYSIQFANETLVVLE